MIEQDRKHIRFQISPASAGGSGDRNEIATEEDAANIAKAKQGFGKGRGFGLFRVGKIAGPRFHHGASGKEFDGRRIGRQFGLDNHACHLGRRQAQGNPFFLFPGKEKPRSCEGAGSSFSVSLCFLPTG